jgi:hypothetical protein
MIIRLAVCFGFMVLGASFPMETLSTASILLNGVVSIAKQIGTVLA